MPLFHFDLYDSIGLVADEEGRELPSLEIVEKEALKGIRSIIGGEVEKGILDLTGRMVVRDGTGAEVMMIPLHEAVTITGRWIPPDASDPAASVTAP